VIEASRDRFQIAVNIGEQCQLHSTRTNVTKRRLSRASMPNRA
jgi:hypothetical protein